jgi:5'-nucleotidase
MAILNCSSSAVNLETAAVLAARLIDEGLTGAQPDGVLYNLNVPDLPLNEIKGLRVTRQGRTIYKDAVDVRNDPRGNEYIWMAGEMVKFSEFDDTDVSLIKQGYASLTPLKYDLTDMEQMDSLGCIIDKMKFHFS